MNTLNSLLIYNPLEAIPLVMFLDVFTKRKFVAKDIIGAYVLGSVNFVAQSLRILFSNPLLIFAYDIVVTFVICSFTLYCYYNIVYALKDKRCAVSGRKAVLALITRYIVISFMIFLLQNIVDTTFISHYANKYYEFVSNISIGLAHLIVIKIIGYGVKIYEKNS